MIFKTNLIFSKIHSFYFELTKCKKSAEKRNIFKEEFSQIRCEIVSHFFTIHFISLEPSKIMSISQHHEYSSKNNGV